MLGETEAGKKDARSALDPVIEVPSASRCRCGAELRRGSYRVKNVEHRFACRWTTVSAVLWISAIGAMDSEKIETTEGNQGSGEKSGEGAKSLVESGKGL